MSSGQLGPQSGSASGLFTQHLANFYVGSKKISRQYRSRLNKQPGAYFHLSSFKGAFIRGRL